MNQKQWKQTLQVIDFDAYTECIELNQITIIITIKAIGDWMLYRNHSAAVHAVHLQGNLSITYITSD